MRNPRAARASSAAAGEPAATPSIYEVARAAGISVATVSRVLNDKGPVRAETRQRVLEAVERLGYVPHSAARSLSTRRTMSIGVLLPDMHGAFFGEIVRGIDLAARAAGYHLLVSGSHSDAAETAALLQTLHGRVDGLILMTPALGHAWLDKVLPRRVPVVLLNPRGEAAAGDDDTAGRHDSLRIDNRLGARLAVEHLIGLGHRSIAFVGGPADNADAAERLAGYREALEQGGLPIVPRLEMAGDFGEESGLRAGAKMAALMPHPTAIFAANDAMAIGCLAAMRERGLRVPEDVSLVGFDDVPIARYLTPALTTVQVPIAELGKQAMARLLAAVDGRPSHPEGGPMHTVIAPTLAIRASTAGSAGALKRTATKRRKIS
ncbi:MAG TPA: LacI family DNA-binding transcriptional regulator [Thermoanaerobaculia bacterium]|nr:LacI family DNA-binding transcriptional regulator [Thermoanaerobaculia bacterium]